MALVARARRSDAVAALVPAVGVETIFSAPARLPVGRIVGGHISEAPVPARASLFKLVSAVFRFAPFKLPRDARRRMLVAEKSPARARSPHALAFIGVSESAAPVLALFAEKIR